MRRVIGFGIALCLLALIAAFSADTTAAAGPSNTCTAGLTIYTTSTGTVTQAGQVTIYQGSGVGGGYTSGFLSGYTLSGAQDILMNNVTHKSYLKGSFVATGPGGTLNVSYVGQADLRTGAATGFFIVTGGTGEFANFHWSGNIMAQLTSLAPPTFVATDSGMCHPAP